MCMRRGIDVRAEWGTRSAEPNHPMTSYLRPSPSDASHTSPSLAPSHPLTLAPSHPHALTPSLPPPPPPRSLSHQVMSFLIKRGGVNVSRILLTHGAEELMVKGQKRSTVFSDAILIKAHNALGVALTAFEPDVNVSAACGTQSVRFVRCAVCGMPRALLHRSKKVLRSFSLSFFLRWSTYSTRNSLSASRSKWPT